jgi:peptidoglycan LD-endopeptidase CwlK
MNIVSRVFRAIMPTMTPIKPTPPSSGGWASVSPVTALSSRDIERLEGVHPSLVELVQVARFRTPFTVIQGLRTLEEQKRLFASGASRTMKSRHLTGHAVDLAPTPLDWNNKESFRHLAYVMQSVADERKIRIRWGGNFAGFFDGPHFELDAKDYPA